MRLIVGVVSILLASHGLAQPKFEIVDVGLLPGTEECRVTAISASGVVAGECFLTRKPHIRTPFSWTRAEGIKPMAAFPKAIIGGMIEGINDSKQVLVIKGGWAYLWTMGEPMAELVLSGYHLSVATLTENGEVLGRTNHPVRSAFYWSPQSRAASFYSIVDAIGSRTGYVAGSYVLGPEGTKSEHWPCIWRPDPGASLLPLVDLRRSVVYASDDRDVRHRLGSMFLGAAAEVNSQGDIVGWMSDGGTPGEVRRHAVIWEGKASKLRAIPIPMKYRLASALQISDQGLVVGNVDDESFLWSEKEGFALICDIFGVHGQLSRALPMNGAGQIAFRRSIHGKMRGFVATPIGSAK